MKHLGRKGGEIAPDALSLLARVCWKGFWERKLGGGGGEKRKGGKDQNAVKTTNTEKRGLGKK